MVDCMKRKDSGSNSQEITKIFGWEISQEQKQKLVRWTIEGVILSIVSFVVLWVPLLIK